MRRTIATLFMIGASAAWAVAADPSPGASGGQRAAQYHIGDGDEAADEAATPPAPASKTKKDALQSVGYFDEVPTKGAVTPASANFASVGEGIGCTQGMSCTSTCDNAGQCCCDDWFCNSARVEYLMWWTRGRNTPPLVTTDPNGGVLPGATILYGDEPIGTNLRNGARVTLSHLLSDDCTSFDVRFWGIEDGSEAFSAGPRDTPLLGIPYANAALLGFPEFIFPIAVPGVAENGSVGILSKNDLIGADAWLRRTWYEDNCSRVDILGGYMFSRMDDAFFLTSTFTFAGTTTTQTINDAIVTQNEFHGIQLGLLATRRRNNNVSVEALGKVALGNMRQQLAIAGNTIIDDGVVVDTTPGGFFAQPSNIGVSERNRFSFVPELNLNLVYDVNACWKVMLGYSFVYYGDVVLAGNQIDRRVNLQQANIDPQLPSRFFAESDFWAQGLSVGTQYQW